MAVLVCVAHPDDEIIGCGATIAKYAETGEEVVVLIFSYGQNMVWHRILHPGSLVTEKEVITKRVNEAKKAAKIVGAKKLHFLGLTEFKFEEQKTRVKKAVRKIIANYQPRLVIFHSVRDMHKDHVFVNKIMNELVGEIYHRPKIMTFQVNLWDLFSLDKTCVLVDVSETFHKKIKALRKFKSQSRLIRLMMPLIRLRGIVHGRRAGYKYAECFYE